MQPGEKKRHKRYKSLEIQGGRFCQGLYKQILFTDRSSFYLWKQPSMICYEVLLQKKGYITSSVQQFSVYCAPPGNKRSIDLLLWS